VSTARTGGGLRGRDLMLVLIICATWSGNFLTSAFALREIPPFLFTAVRLAILALLLGAFVKPPARGQWPRLVAVALCNGVLHFGLSFWSLRLAGNLSSPAIVMQSYVPMAALLAWWWLGERFGWRTGLARGGGDVIRAINSVRNRAPVGVRSSSFTRRSVRPGSRRTRPRDSSRSTSPVTFEASHASVAASCFMGIGRPGSMRCRTWHCVGDNSSAAARLGRCVRCDSRNSTSRCQAAQASGFARAIRLSIVDCHNS